MPDWDAEVEIDEPLVRAVLDEQFPELAASSVRFLGKGWDNSVWVVDETWAFRFPHRATALPLLARELELLPRLAPLLPAPIPVPAFVGERSDLYPWPFFGAALLPGVEVADACLSAGERAEIGATLGRFLRALHDVKLDVELPVDPNRRADMAFRVAKARENLTCLREQGVWTPPVAVERILDSAERLPPAVGDPVLTHGDLHLRHVLVADGDVAAVIDWGDACRADPCIDFALVWSLVDPPARMHVLAEYGPLTEEQLLRARVLALGLDSMLASYAYSVGNEPLLRECRAGLERTLIE